MFISIRNLSANLPLEGQGSLESAIASIEALGSELVSLSGSPSGKAGQRSNVAVFKRRGIGNVPPALHLDSVNLPASDQDAEVDPDDEHAEQVLVGSAPVWVTGRLRLVTAWREPAQT